MDLKQLTYFVTVAGEGTISAAASAVGSILAMPKLMGAAMEDMNASIYGITDYLLLAAVIFSTVLVLVTLISILSAFAKTIKEAQTYAMPVMILVMALGIGLVIGGYDGFFGPGAGTFLMLAFTGLCKFDLLTASGNTKVANSASNLASLITFGLAGKVMWPVGIPAALCGIAGNYLGSSLALKGGAKVIRPMFFVVLALLVARLIYGLAAG